MKPVRISRIMQILTALRTGESYTVSDLSKIFGTSRRTVFRDLQELQAIGVPFRYDVRTRSYIVEPHFFLPPINLNLQEAMSLLLLAHKVGEQIQFPFKRSALLAALKIESKLPVKIRQYCNTALRNVSIKAYPQEKHGFSDRIFAQLLTAILRKLVTDIRYSLPHKQKIIAVNLNPYHLVYNDDTWYVLGKSSLQKGFHAFKLNRIKEINILDKRFIEDKKFNVSEHLDRAWSMIPEGRLYNIKLRFMPKVAHSVAEVRWHNTQRVIFEDDGSAIIEFYVDGLSEITWWILSYGDQVQVLAPKVLQRRIIEIAQNTVKQSKQLLPV